MDNINQYVILEIWYNIREFIPEKQKADAAMAFMLALDNEGLLDSSWNAIDIDDKHISNALEKLVDIDEDEEDDDFLEDWGD